MKPTKEQIEAALRFVDGTASHDDKETLLLSSDELRSYAMAALFILAAAYRELKPWADLAISSNALIQIEKSKKS